MHSIRTHILALLFFFSFGLTTKAEPKIIKDLAYVKDGHKRQVLDLYLPDQSSNYKKPLIVWIHGGAWRSGDKRSVRWRPILKRGFAVASVNYRLSQHATFPAQIHDCKSAIRWLKSKASDYGIDPDRFGVWGSSAGGHLSALVGTSGNHPDLEGTIGVIGPSSSVQAVCDWFGPTDLTLMDQQAGPTGAFSHDSPDSPESQLIGAPIQQHQNLVNRANPIKYIDGNDPPFLIVHGSSDRLVSVEQSKILHQALRESKVASEFQVLLDKGHGRFGNSAIFEYCLDFFEVNLKIK